MKLGDFTITDGGLEYTTQDNNILNFLINDNGISLNESGTGIFNQFVVDLVNRRFVVGDTIKGINVFNFDGSGFIAGGGIDDQGNKSILKWDATNVKIGNENRRVSYASKVADIYLGTIDMDSTFLLSDYITDLSGYNKLILRGFANIGQADILRLEIEIDVLLNLQYIGDEFEIICNISEATPNTDEYGVKIIFTNYSEEEIYYKGKSININPPEINSGSSLRIIRYTDELDDAPPRYCVIK